MYAAAKGHVECIKHLLNVDGCNPDCPEASKPGVFKPGIRSFTRAKVRPTLRRSAFHLAAQYSFSAAASEMLITSGAGLENRDANGMTPFLIACQTGNEGAIRVCLRVKGDVFAQQAFVVKDQTIFGRGALHFLAVRFLNVSSRL